MTLHTPWLPMAGIPTNVIDARGVRVARCDYDGDMDNLECIANARLVAAAPELLEVAKAVVEYCEDQFKRQISPATYQKALDAIAKAEGTP